MAGHVAEIELSLLVAGQCLVRRIATEAEPRVEVSAWEESHNRAEAKIDWRFTTDESRIELRKLYPTTNT